MNPFIAMVIGAILGLKRVCPKCKRVQIISEKRQDTVPCKFCGAALPPKN
jgi:ribosomal protein S27E